MRANSVLARLAQKRDTACNTASTDDALWFQQNPERRHRVRPQMADEFLVGSGTVLQTKATQRLVVVRKLNSGVRIRVSFAAHTRRKSGFGEIEAKAIFEHLLALKEEGIFAGGYGNA